MGSNKLISIADLAREFGMNKSKINYWSNIGLIKPIGTIGRTKVFDSNDARSAIRKILTEKKKSKTNKEILASYEC